MQMNLQQKQA